MLIPKPLLEIAHADVISAKEEGDKVTGYIVVLMAHSNLPWHLWPVKKFDRRLDALALMREINEVVELNGRLTK